MAALKFRGLPACSCLAAWLPVYEAELKRRGILAKNSSLRIYQLIGGAAASGGTHSKGGAFDLLDLPGNEDVAIARQMGADATWSRPRNWDNRGGMAHVHGVLTGCPHNGPARYQIDDVRKGLNGLANHARDTGPRPLSGRTWEQGIEWAKAQAAPPAKSRTTELEVATMNVHGKTSGFPLRVPVIATRVRKYMPHFFVCQELQPAPRALLSVALRSKWRMSSNGHNKVQYLLTNKNGWAKVKSAKYALGNNRHAVAVRYRHRTSGADFVLTTPHPSWEHSAAANRATEMRALIGFLNRDFGSLPKLIAGDFNDSHKDTKTRPNDTSGDVLEAAGYHDLYFDVPTSRKRNQAYNTAHQNETPPPKSGIHIDRFFGTNEFKGLEWTNDVHSGRRGSDHWLVNLRVDLTHPAK